MTPRPILKLTIAILFIMGLISGCAMQSASDSVPTTQCEIIKRHLDLEGYELDTNNTDEMVDTLGKLADSKCKEPECLLGAAPIISVSAGATIITGSIVAKGNTLNWLEKQGYCSKNQISKSVDQLKHSTTIVGGGAIRTTEDLMNWFQKSLSR